MADVRVLVVDDDPGVLKSLRLILEDAEYEVYGASSGEEGIERAREVSPQIILCDVKMPEMSGMEFLEEYREVDGRALVIMITAYGSSALAVEAMKRGAYDYLDKPFSAEEVKLVLKKAEEREELADEVERLRDEVGAERRYRNIVLQSEAMKAAAERAERAARHPTTVLITGESGTGKELIARLVHDASPRHDRDFVAVNCGAIPENLLESELFGHTAGAFTGAKEDRAGLFEEATGGTLFLDEIAELPEKLQVKLFRALQEGEIRRVGESTSRNVDSRIVASTARNLEEMVNEGEFREELYYRVNVVRIHLPPLRHRDEDIAPLVKHFVDEFNEKLGLSIEGFEPDAMRALMDYEWPGNVRELENVVERAMVLSDGPEIGEDDVKKALPGPEEQLEKDVSSLPPDELSVKKHTARLEKQLIERALEVTGGNRTEAAELVDLSYRALLYKIRDYGLEE